MILTSSHFGFPLSTTHVATGAILGAGVGARRRVRWSIAGRMVAAWIITLPAAGLVGAAMYVVAEGIGGNAGVVAVASMAIVGGAAAWLVSRRNPVNAGNVTDVPPVAIVAPEPAQVTDHRPITEAGAGAGGTGRTFSWRNPPQDA